MLDVEQALHRRAIAGHALDRAGAAPAIAHAELVRTRAVVEAHDHAGRSGTEADQLALVAGARRAAGAAVVDGLEQVRLAGAIRPVYDRQAGAQARLGARVRAEVAHLHADHLHAAALTRSA